MTFLIGIFFKNYIDNFIELQLTAARKGTDIPDLSQLIQSIFYNLNLFLIFLIPSITMGLFADEKIRNSFRLLLTSPVFIFQIVLGKFLGAVLFFTMSLLLLSVYPMLIIVFGNPDIYIIMTSCLAIFFITLLYTSIGLFFSAISNSAIIAYSLTSFVLLLLSVLNWLSINIPDSYISYVLMYLSTVEHVNTMFEGVIKISDIIYFIIMISGFLFLTNILIDSNRWK